MLDLKTNFEINNDFKESNFCKSFRFSPDGSSFICTTEEGDLINYTISDYTTNELYLQDLESLSQEKVATLKYARSEPIYDIKWYPHMTITDSSTCCFITTSKDHPIHLWDSQTGSLRCTYKGHNQLDELDSPTSLAFNLTGDKIYAGSNRMIRVFDVTNPGVYSSYPTSSTKKDKFGQKGLISVLEFNPDYSGCYAAGSYANNVHIYVENMTGSALEIQNIEFGITCLKWSNCGHYLYMGGRKHDDIVVWDVRQQRCEIGRIQRPLQSNQRLVFDLHPTQNILVTGSDDNKLLFYNSQSFEIIQTYSHHININNQHQSHSSSSSDLIMDTDTGTSTGTPPHSPPLSHKCLSDLPNECINSVQFHPYHTSYIGLCTGKRHYHLPYDIRSSTPRSHVVHENRPNNSMKRLKTSDSNIISTTATATTITNTTSTKTNSDTESDSEDSHSTDNYSDEDYNVGNTDKSRRSCIQLWNMKSLIHVHDMLLSSSSSE